MLTSPAATAAQSIPPTAPSTSTAGDAGSSQFQALAEQAAGPGPSTTTASGTPTSTGASSENSGAENNNDGENRDTTLPGDAVSVASAATPRGDNGRGALFHPMVPGGFGAPNVPSVRSKIAAAVLNVLAGADNGPASTGNTADAAASDGQNADKNHDDAEVSSAAA